MPFTEMRLLTVRFSRYGSADTTVTTVQGEVNLAVSVSVVPPGCPPPVG